MGLEVDKENTSKPGSAPRNVQVRPLSSSTMVIQWDEPETPNGQVTGYKVYYTENAQLPMASWESQMVDNNQLTTISELTPHTIYTIRVQAFTSVGPGPLSAPVLVKTQQGVPSQPSNLITTDVGETSVSLQWSKPSHSGENIVSYELYWNDTYAKEKHHRRIPISESYTLSGLYPNTLYYIWLAARSQRGEGATTPPIPVRTKQYGKSGGGRLLCTACRTLPDTSKVLFFRLGFPPSLVVPETRPYSVGWIVFDTYQEDFNSCSFSDFASSRTNSRQILCRAVKN
ncbi:hypothetical protein J6590_005340 [Homalodisca vitripennis]|nr:hypothetical protein J6590_005340 [Homalodisca vitripennis]